MNTHSIKPGDVIIVGDKHLTVTKVTHNSITVGGWWYHVKHFFVRIARWSRRIYEP